MKEGISSGCMLFYRRRIANSKVETTFLSGSPGLSGYVIRQFMRKVIRYVSCLFFLASASCMASEITQAGFAFSGD